MIESRITPFQDFWISNSVPTTHDEVSPVRLELSAIAEVLELERNELRKIIHKLSLLTTLQDEVEIDTTYELFDNLEDLIQMIALRMFDKSASKTGVSPEDLSDELKSNLFPDSQGLSDLLTELGLLAYICKQNSGSARLVSLARTRLLDLLITYWRMNSNILQSRSTSRQELPSNKLKSFLKKKLLGGTGKKNEQQSFEDVIARSLHAICYVYQRYVIAKYR